MDPTRIMMCVCCLVVPVMVGCSGVRAPSVAQSGVREIERDGDRAVYAFVLSAENPNDVQLPLKEIRYTVSIDGTPVFEGVRSPQATLDQYSRRTFELPAVIDPGLIRENGLTPYALSGVMTFEPPGRFAKELARSRIHIPSASFDLEGAIDTSAE